MDQLDAVIVMLTCPCGCVFVCNLIVSLFADYEGTVSTKKTTTTRTQIQYCDSPCEFTKRHNQSMAYLQVMQVRWRMPQLLLQ